MKINQNCDLVGFFFKSNPQFVLGKNIVNNDRVNSGSNEIYVDIYDN